MRPSWNINTYANAGARVERAPRAVATTSLSVGRVVLVVNYLVVKVYGVRFITICGQARVIRNSIVKFIVASVLPLGGGMR